MALEQHQQQEHGGGGGGVQPLSFGCAPLQEGLSIKLVKKVVKVVTALCKGKLVSTPFKVMARLKRSVLKSSKDAPCRTFKIDGKN